MLSQPQGHSATGRVMSMKYSIDTIGNRTRDLPACSAVPPRAPVYVSRFLYVRMRVLCKYIVYVFMYVYKQAYVDKYGGRYVGVFIYVKLIRAH